MDSQSDIANADLLDLGSCPFDPRTLTPGEQLVLDAVSRGDVARLDGAESRVVRAEFLRHLLLRLPIPGRNRRWPIRLTGVRVEGARIEGRLDLSGAAKPGIGLPTLFLEDCDIPETLNLEAARISCFSVKRSRFTELVLRETEIDGPFDFTDARSWGGENGLAWIDASNSIINGQLTGNGATLKAPEPREAAEIMPGERRSALRLVNADIRGSIILRNKFSAEGGVCLDTAQVRGDIYMDEATVSAGEDDAFSAQNARIGGMVALRYEFTANGTVWLPGASIGGAFHMTRAKLRTSKKIRDRAGVRLERPLEALVAENAEIGGSLGLIGAKVLGQIRLANARIRSGLEADGARLRYPFRKEPVILAEGISIGHDFEMNGSVVAGKLDLTSARIDGRLALDGTQILRARNGDDTALSAVNATIGKNAEFKRLPKEAKRREFRSVGRLDLTGVSIAGDLIFEASRLSNSTSGTEDKIALSAERACIEGNLVFSCQFLAEGEVKLAGARVGRDLKCGEARFANHWGNAIYAKDLTLGDDLQLTTTITEGNLQFERMNVSGSVRWDGLNIGTAGNRTCLDFRHARIGSALKAEKLCLGGPAKIDLGGTRVGTIQNWSPCGWGIDVRIASPACEINFDGFRYERIETTYRLRETDSDALRVRFGIPFFFGPPANPLGDPLLDWILHQPCVRGQAEDSFFPQPYRQLARVLRSQGEEDAALTVAVAERWAAPQKGLSAVLRWLFGALFGFGLLRSRATITLAVYACIGMFGVMLAKTRNVLIEATVVPASGYDLAYKGDEHRVFIKADQKLGPIEDIPCTDTANDMGTDLVYAADMIVPFIPLHQETKCEIKPRRDTGLIEWRLAKAIYSVLGWIVVSLWLATFSGLLRRAEGEG